MLTSQQKAEILEVAIAAHMSLKGRQAIINEIAAYCKANAVDHDDAVQFYSDKSGCVTSSSHMVYQLLTSLAVHHASY